MLVFFLKKGYLLKIRLENVGFLRSRSFYKLNFLVSLTQLTGFFLQDSYENDVCL